MSLVSGFKDEAKNCITKELEKWGNRFLEVNCVIQKRRIRRLVLIIFEQSAYEIAL